MNPVTHTIRLRSSAHFGREAPPEPLGTVLQVIPTAVRRSVLMAVQGRSTARQARPDWLQAATDVRLVDYAGEDETILRFSSPRLGDAAPQLYEQKQLWPTLPDPRDTGLDLLADVLTDVAFGNPDSDRFDRTLLRQLARFRPALESAFEVIEVVGSRHRNELAARLDMRVLETAEHLRTSTPASRPARVAGVLDMVRASTRTFVIHLDQGENLRGVLAVGDIRRIAPLLGERVLVSGRVQYKPSGRPLRIDAESVSRAVGDVSLWGRIPPPTGRSLDTYPLRQPQGPRSGVAAVIGHWPGNESDEEIRGWLREIS